MKDRERPVSHQSQRLTRTRSEPFQEKGVIDQLCQMLQRGQGYGLKRSFKKLFPPWAWSIDSALNPRGDVSGSRTGAVPTWETSDHIDKSYQVDLGLLSTYSVLG